MSSTPSPRYFKFVAQLLSASQQQQARDALNAVLDSKDEMLSAFADMLRVNVTTSGGPNATATITAAPLLQLDKRVVLEQVRWTSTGGDQNLPSHPHFKTTTRKESPTNDPPLPPSLPLRALPPLGFRRTLSAIWTR